MSKRSKPRGCREVRNSQSVQTEEAEKWASREARFSFVLNFAEHRREDALFDALRRARVIE